MSCRTWIWKILEELVKENVIDRMEGQSMDGDIEDERWKDMEKMIVDKSKDLEGRYLGMYLKGQQWVSELVEL